MKQLLPCLILFFSVNLYAQKQTDNWYFGYKAGLNFSSGEAEVVTDGRIDTREGCSTMSDANGNLLFYTDGKNIYNKQHALMANILMGHESATQSALIVPLPGSNNKYYVFTVSFQANPKGFRSSIVDMSLNNGLGGLTQVPNQLIATPVCEKLAAVKQRYGNGYWVMVHDVGSNNFLAYPVTASGIGTPVVSSIGTVIPLLETENNGTIGYMHFSSDGKKVACANYKDNVELFDFDNATGKVTNPQVLGNFVNPYGVEFSVSGKKLYASMANSVGNYRVVQFDLTAADIAASATDVYVSYRPINALQLASNGKIYIAEYSGVSVEEYYMSTINAPENNGIACDLTAHSITLGPVNFCKLGLPNFIASYFAEDAGVQMAGLPKGISPNDDGMNDAFDLSGFEVSKLSIFNRYGLEVYNQNNYTNEWHGQTNNGNNLPTGTYYYAIESAAPVTKTGWVYINRQEN